MEGTSAYKERQRVSLEILFGTLLPAAINIIVLGEFQNLIEIDSKRIFLYDVNN